MDQRTRNNTRSPRLGGCITRAVSLGSGYSADGGLETKEDFFCFSLFRFPWLKFSFCRFKRGRITAAPSYAVPNYTKCVAGLGVGLCTLCLSNDLFMNPSEWAYSLCAAPLMPIRRIMHTWVAFIQSVNPGGLF